jgi:formate hydrogenlyase transcriptional activator
MPPLRRFEEQEDDVVRYMTLLETADLVVEYRDLSDILSALALLLHRVLDINVVIFSLYDPVRHRMRAHMWHKGKFSDAPEFDPVNSPSVAAWTNQRPITLPDLTTDERFPEAGEFLRQRGVNSYCVLPLTAVERRMGALGIGSSRPNCFTDADLISLGRIAKLVGLAAENVITRAALQYEKERLDVLLEVSKDLLSNPDQEDVVPVIAEFVRRAVPQSFSTLALYDPETGAFGLHQLQRQLADAEAEPPVDLALCDFPYRENFLHGESRVCTEEEMRCGGLPFFERMLSWGVKSFCMVPLINRRGNLGALFLGSVDEHAITRRDLTYLAQVGTQIAIALDNAAAYREIQTLTDRLRTERVYLQHEISSTLNFEEIVGDSPALRRVLGHVQTVAPSDATVLILGETGTGKELVARAIHRMSSRREGSFIKLNCAAIPTGLLESELFGHEKGAFTGAVSQKVGRLELADQGTLFLDEVGEIPLELQPKLLRVLQDQEFERLGGTRTIRVNVRLVAATNRDLPKSVAKGDFRSDLFYRLHVFPVHMPPLRERTVDIPPLVRYFIQKFARRMNKEINEIPSDAMNALIAWHWPGNVRELENFMERSVILSEGPTLNVPLSEFLIRDESDMPHSSLIKVEREHILHVLRDTGGVIAGIHGAAARLGMKRTTLQSKMLRMGISRTDYEC